MGDYPETLVTSFLWLVSTRVMWFSFGSTNLIGFFRIDCWSSVVGLSSVFFQGLTSTLPLVVDLKVKVTSSNVLTCVLLWTYLKYPLKTEECKLKGKKKKERKERKEKERQKKQTSSLGLDPNTCGLGRSRYIPCARYPACQAVKSSIIIHLMLI